jgi:uncharacterized protein
VKPLYFGTNEQPLFGIYHPPQGRPARDAGVVILPPLGQEAVRAHRALRQLALQLSAARFHVLRFDWYGSGDSSGDLVEATMAQWAANAVTATEELEDMAAVTKVHWVGLKLGASLGALAARGRRDLDTLVMWDPVVGGRTYLAELRAMHAEHLQLEFAGRTIDAQPEPDEEEILGFGLGAALREELLAFDLCALPPPSARRVFAITTREGEAERVLRAHLEGLTPPAVYRHVPLAVDWNSEEAMNRSLVPGEAVQAIVACLA